MSLITDDWRLKILAFGLAVLMLGAVAFSQNPPTQKTLRDVSIVYAVSPDIVVIDAPTKTNVTVTGLADALTTVNSGNIAASFDLTKASPGPSVHVDLVIRSALSTVQVQNAVVPYVLHIDKLVAKDLPVQVRTPRIAPGWALTKIEAICPGATPTPCAVTFTGPASWEDGLTAKVDFPGLVQQDSQEAPSIPVQLVHSNDQLLDLSKQAVPAIKFEPSAVTISAQAKAGTTLRQVVLITSAPTHGPATGYRVNAVTIDPVTVVISGAPEELAKITRITLPAVDLSGATSNKTFQVTIPYPAAITPSGSPATAKVTYSIGPDPNVSPSP